MEAKFSNRIYFFILFEYINDIRVQRTCSDGWREPQWVLFPGGYQVFLKIKIVVEVTDGASRYASYLCLLMTQLPPLSYCLWIKQRLQSNSCTCFLALIEK